MTNPDAFSRILFPLATENYEFPVFPTIAALVGAAVLVLFLIQAFRAPRTVQVAHTPAPVPITIAAAPQAPPQPQYKRAPFFVRIAGIPDEFPDVWGVNEPLEISIRAEDKSLQNYKNIPGLNVYIEGKPIPVAFNRGQASIRYTYRTTGEKVVMVELRLKNETLGRRAQGVLKIVDYRTEIAEVFANFREEASRAIVPIHHDATPWEIYDLISGANARIPEGPLRHIVSSFEEAKFSNHPVTRGTYERMIRAILELERVEL